ncbi:MAG: type II toxin-antitoxin system VapC family toxin [Myxococcales bacterium]|nr:type II toxin-antitoxin system VapC family toxin [Myxococcales bacterium]
MTKAWQNAQSSCAGTRCYTQAEILHGILLLPKGKRRDALAAAADRMFDEDFAGRVLAFGSDAARACGEIASVRRRAGRPITSFDAQVAAIARSLSARLATRNVDHFQGCGIDVLDPWGD